jgi:hypothetical protein
MQETLWTSDDRALAWAAGLFDGEGNFGTYSRRGPYGDYIYPRAQLAMQNEGCVRDFAEAVGFGTVLGPYGPYSHQRRPTWAWMTSRANDVERIALRLAPWLREEKLVAAVNALTAATPHRRRRR